jgi:hypothetical protein
LKFKFRYRQLSGGSAAAEEITCDPERSRHNDDNRSHLSPFIHAEHPKADLYTRRCAEYHSLHTKSQLT